MGEAKKRRAVAVYCCCSWYNIKLQLHNYADVDDDYAIVVKYGEDVSL